MRLATRTGLASFVAASITLLAVGSLFRGYFATVLQERVDSQLKERAATAPILAAVAERLAQSELRTTLEGARVVTGGQTISLGLLPDDPLPQTIAPGWSTARASGDRWRMYTVEVSDVPRLGDKTLVQLVAPLGDVDARARQLRRRVIFVMGLDIARSRSGRLPARQDRDSTAHCVAARHRAHRGRRSAHLACRRDLRFGRGRRCGDGAQREPPTAGRRDAPARGGAGRREGVRGFGHPRAAHAAARRPHQSRHGSQWSHL